MIKKPFIILCTLLIFLLVVPFSSHALDEQWFKLTTKIKGTIINVDTEALTSANYNLVSYLYVTASGSGYSASIWSLGPSGVWSESGGGPITRTGTDNEFWSFNMTLRSGSNIFDVYLYARMVAKKATSGAVKSATLVDNGCLVLDSTVGGSDLKFLGKCDVKGKTVLSAKLPFKP